MNRNSVTRAPSRSPTVSTAERRPDTHPTLFNRAYGKAFMWDGTAKTLEEQVLLPIQNPLEMELSLDEALTRLKASKEYPALFKKAFGTGPDRKTLALAIAAFVRRIVIGDSPIDRFRSGLDSKLSPAERTGLWVYESKGQCWRCHSGSNFSDEGFHNTGVALIDGQPREGRFKITAKDADRGGFKTPTLRGLKFTAPYMHDGSIPTLKGVVEFYSRGGNANSHLDAKIKPLALSDREIEGLVAFLLALSK